MMAGHRTFSTMKVVPAMILIILLLGGCASTPSNTTSATSGSSNGIVNLTFWSWVAGIENSVAAFNQSHPNIHVTLSNVGSGPTEYNKLYTAIKGNNEPDLAQVEYQLLPTFETTGALVDMAKYGAGSVKDTFVPWT
ncbi:MAG TPA: extracellular solute-binding protein, partial [Ktedonobacteraceae bacterium]|nr:extracellular solute-binding protein [Ktedonobacteraceae bacterium]